MDELGGPPRRIMTGQADDRDDPRLSLSAVVQAVMAAQRIGQQQMGNSLSREDPAPRPKGKSGGKSGGASGPPRTPGARNPPQRTPSGRPVMAFDFDEAAEGPAGDIGFPMSPSMMPDPDSGGMFEFPQRVVSGEVGSNVRISEVDGLPFGAVIHFTNCFAELDILRPWKVNAPGMATGTGFHIGNKRILTNNHVVEFGTSIRVRRHGVPGNFEAKVLCGSAVCDLALVTVEEDEFWEGVPVVTFQEAVPSLDDTVVAVGYPMHASTVTLTRGVVSNVHLKDLSLSTLNEEQLCVQIDAAINPGNSGGPVFNQETHEVVGVAFAGMTDAEGMGFIIPTPVVKNFIRIYDKTGEFEGLPALGLSTQELVNKSLRKFAFGEPTKHNDGVLIQKVQPFSAGKRAGVTEGDILMAIDGEPVSEEGEVVFRGHERVGWQYLISKRAIGDTVSLSLLRKEEGADAIAPVKVDVKLSTAFAMVPRELGKNGFEAHFVVCGGLVMLTASVPLMKACIEEGEMSIFEAIVKIHRKEYECEDEDEEGVVVSDCLAHEINVGYGAYIGRQVKEINGVPVRNLRHAAELVAKSSDEFIVVKFTESNRVVAFDRAVMRAAMPVILTQHKIPNWTSYPGFEQIPLPSLPGSAASSPGRGADE